VRREEGPRKSTRRPSQANTRDRRGWRMGWACRPSALCKLPGCPARSSQARSSGLLFQ